MFNNRIKMFFYLWFSIIPLFCMLLDLFMSVIEPIKGSTTASYPGFNFDYSMINQIIYFSMWNAFLTSTWGILQIVGLYSKKLPKWCTSKNFATTILTYSTLVFFVFLYTFIFVPNQIVDFEGWYKILKSVLDHFVTPTLLLIFYFIGKKHEVVGTNYYSKFIAWYNLIFPSIYLIFIYIRCFMLHIFFTNTTPFVEFPYIQVDPYHAKPYIVLIDLFMVLSSCYGFSILLNFLTNVITVKLDKTISKKPYQKDKL